MRRAVLGGAAAVLAASALLAPIAAAPSAASWRDASFSRGRLDVVPGDCSAPAVFEASSSAALLAGTVQGVPVGEAAFAPVGTGARISAVAVSRPLSADAVGPAPVVGGVALPVRLVPRAAWAQTAATTGTGASSAAAGAGGALGAIDVSGLLERSPSAAGLLPGLSGVALDVGRAEAVATLDGCAAAFGATGALARTSAAAVGLRATDSDAVAALAAMRTSGGDVAVALAGRAAGAASPIGEAAAGALLLAVRQALTAAGASAAGAGTLATVAVAPEAIAAAGTGVQRSGAATLDPVSGAATADLTAVAGGGPDADVVTPDSVAGAAAAIGGALQQQAGVLVAAERSVRDGTSVRVRPVVDVSLTVGLATTRVATVSLDVTAPASDWSAGTAAAPRVSVALLGGAPIAAVAGLADAVDARLGALLTAAMQQAVRAEYLQPATAVIEQAAASTASSVLAARAGLVTHLAALPDVLRVTADQRPRTGADAWTGSDPPGVHQLTALRVRVRTPAGGRADLSLANVAVGPDRAAFR